MIKRLPGWANFFLLWAAYFGAGLVLDPFLGSGTTALVARQLGRECIGIELNPEYCRMAEKRVAEVGYQADLPMEACHG